jgi:hypothetical protein
LNLPAMERWHHEVALAQLRVIAEARGDEWFKRRLDVAVALDRMGDDLDAIDWEWPA